LGAVINISKSYRAIFIYKLILELEIIAANLSLSIGNMFNVGMTDEKL